MVTSLIGVISVILNTIVCDAWPKSIVHGRGVTPEVTQRAYTFTHSQSLGLDAKHTSHSSSRSIFCCDVIVNNREVSAMTNDVNYERTLN